MPTAKNIVKKLVLNRETVRKVGVKTGVRAGAKAGGGDETGSWANTTHCGSGGGVVQGDSDPSGASLIKSDSGLSKPGFPG